MFVFSEMYVLIITPLPHIDPVLCGLAKTTLRGKQGRGNHFHAPHGGSSPEKLRSLPHWEWALESKSGSKTEHIVHYSMFPRHHTKDSVSTSLYANTDSWETCVSFFSLSGEEHRLWGEAEYSLMSAKPCPCFGILSRGGASLNLEFSISVWHNVSPRCHHPTHHLCQVRSEYFGFRGGWHKGFFLHNEGFPSGGRLDASAAWEGNP